MHATRAVTCSAWAAAHVHLAHCCPPGVLIDRTGMTAGGVERREACVAQLQANHAQNVFMLVVPVVAGLHSFSPGEDPVVAAIAFARYADGQRHVVALLPGGAHLLGDVSIAVVCPFRAASAQGWVEDTVTRHCAHCSMASQRQLQVSLDACGHDGQTAPCGPGRRHRGGALASPSESGNLCRLTCSCSG